MIVIDFGFNDASGNKQRTGGPNRPTRYYLWTRFGRLRLPHFIWRRIEPRNFWGMSH